MIDYFMVPFPAPNDNEAMAGIAHEVNREDMKTAIQNAPHHFELYSLGEIDENGIINAKKDFVCDCSILIRPRRQSGESAASQAAKDSARVGGRTERIGSDTRSNSEAVPEGATG